VSYESMCFKKIKIVYVFTCVMKKNKIVIVFKCKDVAKNAVD
jgi:hypothetical protein